MSVLSISRKDLLILLKDRSTILELFVLPLVFIVLYTGIGSFVESESAAEDSRIELAIVDLDQGALAQSLIDNLDTEGGIRPVFYEQAEAQQMVDDGELARLLTIPAGFTEQVEQGEDVALQLLNEGGDVNENASVSLIVNGVASDLSLQTQIIGSLEHLRQMQGSGTAVQEAISADRAIAQAESQFERAQQVPLIGINQKEPGTFEERESVAFTDVAVPGMTALFVFLTAQATARSVYDEKRVGSFRRLLAAPVSHMGILIGKMLPNFFLVLLQVVVILAAGLFLFPALGIKQLSLGSDTGALVLLILATALCSTAMGALISAVAHTEAQIGGISSLVLWGLAFVGGAIFPLFLLNDTLAAIGKVTPHYWAVTGFYDLMVRGQTLTNVTDSILALLGFSVLFFGLAIWRFDFD